MQTMCPALLGKSLQLGRQETRIPVLVAPLYDLGKVPASVTAVGTSASIARALSFRAQKLTRL